MAVTYFLAALFFALSARLEWLVKRRGPQTPSLQFKVVAVTAGVAFGVQLLWALTALDWRVVMAHLLLMTLASAFAIQPLLGLQFLPQRLSATAQRSASVTKLILDLLLVALGSATLLYRAIV